jgi:COP9 signalosome complex subunit 7
MRNLTISRLSENQAQLPTLNQAQLAKLKQLSIVSLANQSRVFAFTKLNRTCLTIVLFQILPYSQLLAALDVPSIRVLEDLIIDAIYADIVRGKLDQKQQQFEVQYTMGRDLRPGQLEELLGALQDWYVGFEPPSDSTLIVMVVSFRSSRISTVLDALDGKIADIELNDNRSKEILADHDLARQTTVTEILSTRFGNNPLAAFASTRKGDREKPYFGSLSQSVFEEMEVDLVSPSSPPAGGSSSQNTRKKPASSSVSGGPNARKRVRGGP